MPRPHISGENRASLYQEITDAIIAQLEAGRVPWVQPWAASATSLDMPYNAATGHRYSGVNILILWDSAISHGFARPAFLTFRQTLALGGHVRRGERGTTVVYAGQFTPTEERRRAATEDREPGRIMMLKRFTVFNVDQCGDLPEDIAPPAAPISDALILPAASRLIEATGADFRVGGDEAYYMPSADMIQVPRPDSYFEPIDWHRTAFHELGHWTGHRSRLDRDLGGGFGSATYGREELIAEMAGAFVCAALGIVPSVRHADYLGSWLEILREDNRAIVRAASAASRAADYLLAFQAAASRASGERRAA